MTMQSGARLAYLVVEMEGTVRRPVHKWTKAKGLTVVDAEEPAGYLVYCPRGHVVRLKDRKALKQYGVSEEAPIVNIAGLQDPNSKVGKMMRSQDAEVRRKGYADLEKQVQQLAQAKSGVITLIRDPSVELEDVEAA